MERRKAAEWIASRMIRSRLIQPLDPRRPLPEGFALWYVFLTLAKKEFHAAHWLEDNGWASLTPLVYHLRAHERRGVRRVIKRKRTEAPLIPRITLAAFSGAPPWLRVDDCRYITGVLGIGGTPMPIRAGEIERLRMTSEALLAPINPKPFLPGQKVRIVAPGLFQGHVVEVRSVSGKHARIIQSWFGSMRETEIDLDKLDAA